VSEVMIVRAGIEGGHLAVSVVAVMLLVLAFGGLLRSLQRMLDGEAPASVRETSTSLSLAPAALALGLLVLTGLAWPPGLGTALARIVAVVGP
jgi:hypothetical protein